MTTNTNSAPWFLSRNCSNGRPDVTTYDVWDITDENARRLLDTLELGSRASKELAR